MIPDLVREARRAGLAVGTDRALAFGRAVEVLGPSGLYWAGRLTLCGGPDDIAVFDGLFRPSPVGARRHPVPIGSSRGRSFFGAASSASSSSGPAVRVAASDAEVLRGRDIAELSDVERAEALRLIGLLRPAVSVRRSRRWRSSSRGSVDPRRSARAVLRAGGEAARLSWRRRRSRPRRLVLLVDVSGSMSVYADALLRLAAVFVRLRPRWTHVFSLGTRLTVLRGPALDTSDIPDWKGGTRLATSLTAYLRRFGHRGQARGAVVVIFSDGWERGDPVPLGVAMAHLRRLAHRVIWVSPHAARPGFAPLAGGLVAALPHIDSLVAGHSVAAVSELARVIADA